MSEGEQREMYQPEAPIRPLTERRLARMKHVVARRLGGLTAILDGLHDPHNVGACLRSCDAFGVHRVHIVPEHRKLEINPKVTIGAHRWLDLHVYEGISGCLETVKGQGFRLYAADASPHSTSLEDLDFSQPAALILGAEHHGLSEESLAAADACYHLSMFGFSQSLNVSVATALSIYIASRLRREALQTQGDLRPDEQQAILEAWVQRDQDPTRRR